MLGPIAIQHHGVWKFVQINAETFGVLPGCLGKGAGPVVLAPPPAAEGHSCVSCYDVTCSLFYFFLACREFLC